MWLLRQPKVRTQGWSPLLRPQMWLLRQPKVRTQGTFARWFVCLRGVQTPRDQSQALRIVVLDDRLYERAVPVVAGGVPFDELFDAEMLAGGYRKKYLRALSRLDALATAATAASPSDGGLLDLLLAVDGQAPEEVPPRGGELLRTVDTVPLGERLLVGGPGQGAARRRRR